MSEWRGGKFYSEFRDADGRCFKCSPRGRLRREEILLAGRAVEKYGPSLVGREIVTVQVGAWPGGRVRVLELYNDPAAPEIVLQVKAVENNTRVTQAVFAGRLDSDEIGVFENEEIILLDSPALTEEESQLVIGAIPLQALPEDDDASSAAGSGG